METHTDTAVAESPAPEVAQAELNLPENAVEQLPEQPSADLSLSEALDAALGKLESGEEAAPPVEQPKEEVKEEVKEEPKEEAPLADEVKEETSSDNPLDNLTEEIDDWTPKAANRFKELKGELKSSQTELDKLRQTVEEQNAKLDEMSGLVENRDIDKLQEAVSDYEYDRAFDNLEDTVAYKEAITNPLNDLMDRATQIGDHYNVDSDTVIDILSIEDQTEQDAALQQHFGEATDRDRASLYRLIDAVDPLLQQRQQMYENVEQALNEANLLEEQRVNNEKASAAKHRSNVTENVVNRVSEKLPFLQGVEGLDMQSIKTKVSETDPDLVHPVDFAYNAVAAQLLPVVVKQYMSSRKDVDNLMDKLSSYEDAEPTMSGTPASDSPKARSGDLSFSEAISAALS